MKSFSKIIVVICAGLLFYGFIYYTVSTGGAFRAFYSWCGQAQSLTAVVGKFQKAVLMPYGTFYEKDKGKTGLAGFTVRIVGSANTINAKVTMKREDNTWKVEQVLISGKLLDTN